MEQTLIETIEYRGYSIEEHYDTNAESPDAWGNEDIFLVFDHRDFTLNRKGFDTTEIFERWQNFKTYKGYWMFPVTAYIHSGIVLRSGSNAVGWDLSFKGFVLVERKQWWKKDKAEEASLAMIEEWNQYLSGEVYGYNSDIDSCWGFYGDEGRKQMVEEAKSEIDWHIENKFKEKQAYHFMMLKKWIKNRVPYYHRSSASNLFAARLNVMKAEKCPESSLKLIEHGTDID